MGRMLSERVQTVAIEMAQHWLRPQSCSSEELLVMLLRAGFKLDVKTTPSCAFDLGAYCDLMVDKAAAAAPPPCRWIEFEGSHRCV